MALERENLTGEVLKVSIDLYKWAFASRSGTTYNIFLAEMGLKNPSLTDLYCMSTTAKRAHQ